MKYTRKAGATSNIFQIFVADSSSLTGAGLTGLVFNSASLTAYYHRDTDTTATAMTLVTMTVGTFTSLGFKEIDATNMPGWYQFCPPDAALAASAKSCAFHLKGATNMAPLPLEVELVAYDPQDTVRLGLTALPNVASGNSGAIPTVGTGTAQISVSSGQVILQSGTGTGQLSFTSGVVQADAAKIGGTTQTGRDLGTSVLLSSGTGTGQVSLSSGLVRLSATGVDDIWDEATSGHVTAGTFGEANQPFAAGTLAAVNSTSSVDLASASHAVKDSWVYFYSATTGAGQVRQVLTVVSATVTFAALTTALTGTVKYLILGAPPSITDSTVAAAVWDLARSGHATAGTFGEYIDAAVSSRSTVTTAQVNTECDTALSDAGVTSTRMAKQDTMPSATAGTAGGLFIAGANAATSITTALTANIVGNITGNLSGTVSTLTTYTGNTPQTGDAYARLGAPAGASHAADVAAVKVDTASLVTKVDTIDDFLDTEMPAATVSLAAIKAKTDNLPTDPADASDIAGSFSTVNATLATIAGYVDTEVAAVLAAVDTEVAAIKAKTDNLPASPAAVGSAMVLSTAGYQAAADALLARNIAGGSDGVRTVSHAMQFLRNKKVVDKTGLTFSVKAEDDTTESWGGTVTLGAGNPVITVDPA